MPMKSVAVFSGSSAGADPQFKEEAARLGRALAQRGIELVCGGGRSGLMQAVAMGSLNDGGKVTAVIPPTERDDSIAQWYSRVVMVRNLHERKAEMSRLSDGFLALPGGSGTLEEFMEQWTWAQVGLHAKPLGLLNINGYYDPLVHMLENMRSFGFTKHAGFKFLRVSSRLEDLLEHLEQTKQPAPPTSVKDATDELAAPTTSWMRPPVD